MIVGSLKQQALNQTEVRTVGDTNFNVEPGGRFVVASVDYFFNYQAGVGYQDADPVTSFYV